MAASSSITTFKCSPAGLPIFEGEDYDIWSTQMRSFFILEDLWDLVENSYESSQSQEEYSAWSEARKEKKEHKMKDAKALYYIQQAITKTIAPRIMTATKSKEAWEILKNEFQGSAKEIVVKLQTVCTEFDNLMMKEGESIQIFFSRVFTIIYQLKACGGIIEDERVVKKVLRSLPIKFNCVVAAIKESTNLSTLSLHELMGSLQVEEKRMNRFSDQPLEQAFQTKMKMSENKDGENKKQNQGNQFQRGPSNRGHGRGISKSKSCCKNTNHGSMDCHFKKCTRCKNPSHLERDCWFREKNEANFSEKGESSNQQFYPCMNTQQEAQDMCYIDSRCSNHMTGNKSSFVKLDEGEKSKVKLGDGKVQNIEGKGTIAVQTKGANSCIPLSVPSGDEVESAISGITSFLQSDAGSEVGSLPLISSLDSPGKLQSVEGMTIQKDFDLLNRAKPIQQPNSGIRALKVLQNKTAKVIILAAKVQRMAASSSITTFKYSPAGPPIFEGENYHFWSTQMRIFFISEDLWDLVENSYESFQSQEEYSAWSEARKEKLKEHKMKDAKALYYIQQAITITIAPRIMAATKSKEAWEILKNEFQGSEKAIVAKRQTLWREFGNLMMEEGESIEIFFSRVFTVINQLKGCGGIIRDKRAVEKVLRSLPIKYDRVVAGIKESTNLSTLTLHELMGSLQVDEERMDRFSHHLLEQSFQTKMNMSEKTDGGNKKQNQGSQFQRGRSNCGHGRGGKVHTQRTARDISQSESCCKFCKNTNHGSMDCSFKKPTRFKNNNHLEKDSWFRNKDEANFSEKGESSNQQFYPYMNSQQEPQDTRDIDSRCSNHMMGNKSSFVSLDDGKFQNIKGKSTIAVQTKGAMEASTSSEVNFQIPASSGIPLSVPSVVEGESAISGFTSSFQSEAGSKVGSLPLISSPDGLGKLQSVEGMTIQKSFELMDNVKPIQNVVKALATNDELRNAFLKVKEVQEFTRRLNTGDND